MGRGMSDVIFPSSSPPSDVDVLVVGAGPVGLSAAVELTARGVDVAVVDAARGAQLVRAGAMGHSPRVVEHFHRWGLLQRIRDEWTFPPEWNRGIRLATSLTGHTLRPRAARSPNGHSLALPIRRPQTALQRVFLSHLAEKNVPVTGGWRVTAIGEKDATVVHDTTGETRSLLDTARAASGVDLELELASSTRFFRATRIASMFRSGRVFLAGDAAHVRTPGGNLGEGFGDVVNLGWKLAAVLQGRAPDALLDSYDAERRPHNWRVADHALKRSQQAAETLAEIRRIGVPDDADLRPAAVSKREQIAALLDHGGEAPGVIFDERYDASPIVRYSPDQARTDRPWSADHYEHDPRPGHRAPDGRLDPWGYTLYDRIGNDFALIVPGDQDPAAFVAAAASRDLPLTVIHLTGDGLRDIYGTGLTLVRPDQHVAWRGSTVDDAGAVLDVALAL
jgi:2-polyprenyl-6-methoxyphenol hydroxylase-like FAD-dependent oxidoreductase